MSQIKALNTDEVLKLKAIVLYIVNQCKVIDIFHILKILYFADKQHYAEWGTRLTMDTFVAMDNGPVASNLYDALKHVRNPKHLAADNHLRLISEALFIPDEMYHNYLSAKEEPDMDELSKSDLLCLDHSIEENSETSFSVLSQKSHDIAWTEARAKHVNSPMNPITMAKAGGASQETLDFIQEQEELNRWLEN